MELKLINSEVMRFIIAGSLSTLVNFLFYFLLYKFTLNLIFSASFGYLIGLLNSYILGKTWVFKKNLEYSFKEIIRFLSIYFFGWLGMSLIILGLESFDKFSYIFIWLVGTLYSVLNNFFGSKYIVFKAK